MTRYPRLLDNRLAEISRLTPISQNIDLTIKPLSTADISMQDASEIEMRAYVELYTHKGSAGVFRVSGKETGYGGETDRVSLEHGLCVLGDAVIPEEGEKSGKLKTVLQALIAYQTTKIGGEKAWQIGDVETDEEITYQYTNPNVLEAVLGAVEEVQGYHLEFDQSALPWTLHVRKDATEPSCEGRLNRNVVTARVTLDDTELCTRVYCPLLSDGYIQLEDNPKWGIVSHYIGGNADISESKLKKLLRQYLRARKDPTVSVEIDGLELSEITGEPLDRFEIGKMMRLAMPQYGVTVNERIVSIKYESVFDMPEKVVISLANTPVDVSMNLAQLVGASNRQASGSVRGGGGGVGGGLRSSRSNLTSLLDQADGIEEINGKMTHWFNAVGIKLDGSQGDLEVFAYRSELTSTNEEIHRVALILEGEDGKGGLVYQVEQDGEWITEAGIVLYGEDGLVEVVGRLKAEVAELQLLLGDSITVRTLNVTGAASADSLNVDNTASVGALKIDGSNIELNEVTVLTSNTSLTVNATGGTVTGVTLNKKTETLYYLAWA